MEELKILFPEITIKEHNFKESCKNKLLEIEDDYRECYGSNDKATGILSDASKFIAARIKAGHESPLEHEKVTVRMITNRAIANELVRHRVGSYCMPGDVCIYSDRTNGDVKEYTLSKLAEMNKTPHGRSRIKLIKIRSADENGNITYGKIDKFIVSGKKDVFTVETKLGYVLHCTKEHRIKTPGGFVPLKDIEIGNLIYVNGIEYLHDAEWLKKSYREKNLSLKQIAELCGCSYSTVRTYIRKYGLQKKLGSKPSCFTPWNKGLTKEDERIRTRLITKDKQHRNGYGESNSNWKGTKIGVRGGYSRAHRLGLLGAYTQCHLCDRKSEEVHHIDKNVKNNKLNNLLCLCKKCHRLLHKKSHVRHIILDEVVSIKYRGFEETYDLTVLPHHNFVANGVIVHNSQASTRYINYKDKFAVIYPLGLDADSVLYWDWINAMAEARLSYLDMLEHGAKKDLARGVLPLDFATNIIVTYNLRAWRHFFKMRCSRAAHPQFRQIAIPILLYFRRNLPGIFEDIEYDINFDPKNYAKVCDYDGK